MFNVAFCPSKNSVYLGDFKRTTFFRLRRTIVFFFVTGFFRCPLTAFFSSKFSSRAVRSSRRCTCTHEKVPKIFLAGCDWLLSLDSHITLSVAYSRAAPNASRLLSNCPAGEIFWGYYHWIHIYNLFASL